MFVRLFCSSCCLFVLAAPEAVLVFSSAAFVIVPVKQIGICIFVLAFLQVFQRSLLVHQSVVGFAGLIIVLAHSLEKFVILLLRNFHTTGLPSNLCADILTSFLGNLLIGCNIALAGFPQRVFLIGRFQQIFVGFQLLGIVLGNLLCQSFSGFLRWAGAARRRGLCSRRTRATQRFQNILGCCGRSTKHAAQGINNISSFIRDISLGCIHATKKGRTDATIQCQETVLHPICLAKANTHACQNIAGISLRNGTRAMNAPIVSELAIDGGRNIAARCHNSSHTSRTFHPLCQAHIQPVAVFLHHGARGIDASCFSGSILYRFGQIDATFPNILLAVIHAFCQFITNRFAILGSITFVCCFVGCSE